VLPQHESKVIPEVNWGVACIVILGLRWQNQKQEFARWQKIIEFNDILMECL
jgi:hypothetical protein